MQLRKPSDPSVCFYKEIELCDIVTNDLKSRNGNAIFVTDVSQKDLFGCDKARICGDIKGKSVTVAFFEKGP